MDSPNRGTPNKRKPDKASSPYLKQNFENGYTVVKKMIITAEFPDFYLTYPYLAVLHKS